MASTRAVLHAYELEVEQRENVLAVLLGRTPVEIVQQRILPSATVSETSVPLLPADLPSTLLVRRPDIRAAEAQIVAAAGDVGEAGPCCCPGSA